MVDESSWSTVKAVCSECKAEGEYAPSAFRVTSLETTSYLLGYYYEFFCVTCRTCSRFTIDTNVHDVLVKAGVAEQVIDGPDEIAEILSNGKAKICNGDVVVWVRQLTENEDTVHQEIANLKETQNEPDPNTRSRSCGATGVSGGVDGST